MQLLAETTEDGWRPGIGDPTFMGWFTVAAYLIAAFLCWRAFRAARNSQLRSRRAEKRLWLVLMITFAVLAVNKQLDLQSWFTAVGREVAERGGWYEQRQSVQTAFIATLAVFGCAAIAWLIWITRHSFRTTGLAVAGTAFVIVFVVIRAASFHHVDELLGWTFLGLEMNWVFELGGIACVAIGAARAVRSNQSPISGRPGPESRNATKSATNERDSFRWMVQRIRQR